MSFCKGNTTTQRWFHTRFKQLQTYFSLSIFDKIIEKIIHKKLYAFLENHKILFENQFGFRKNNSTKYALMEITEKIKESIDR